MTIKAKRKLSKVAVVSASDAESPVLGAHSEEDANLHGLRPVKRTPQQKFSDLCAALSGTDGGQSFFKEALDRAMNVNERVHRDRMRYFVTAFLVADKPLPEAAREWLIYVLENIKDAPHGARGAPRKDQEHLINAIDLAHFLAEKSGGVIPMKLTSVLRDTATHALYLSAAEVRRIFDSKDFTTTRELLR